MAKKTYNGVALLSRRGWTRWYAITRIFLTPQKRLIAATVQGVRVISAYIPNGQEVGSDKYAYKLDWLKALERWLSEELSCYPQLALAGDFNIAPEDPGRAQSSVLGRADSLFRG